MLRARNPGWTEQEYKEIGLTLGIGAVKYADLSSHRVSDYVFSYDRMLRFEGNTAAFIMYSYVRCASILRKVSLPKKDGLHLSLQHPSEILLAKTICQLPRTIEEVVESLLPNRLTDYLYTLAEAFNGFFRDCRVEGDVREQERAVLVYLTGEVLKAGLHLLGIDTPTKM
jgi:arginyl-tRNA synthetase